MSQKLTSAQHPNENQTGVTRRSKLVIVGDCSVGKSSIGLRFTAGIFRPEQERTLGAVFLQRRVRADETLIHLDIWDTAGQERFRSLAPMYYRNAHAAIVVYDVTRRDTFKPALTWVNEIRRASPNAVVALAGNKSDLSDGREVYSEEAEAFAQENGLLFMETSAKTGLNIDELFLAIAEGRPKKDPNEVPKKQEDCTVKNDDGQVSVHQGQGNHKRFGCC